MARDPECGRSLDGGGHLAMIGLVDAVKGRWRCRDMAFA
jgi:hypothetical protein